MDLLNDRMIKDTYYSNNIIFWIKYLTGIKTFRFLAITKAPRPGSRSLDENLLGLVDDVE